MTDERVDRQVRMLEIDAVPDAATVSRTFDRLEPHVRRARRQDASSLWRLQRRLLDALAVKGVPWATGREDVRWALLAIALVVAMVGIVLAVGSGPRVPPQRWETVVELHGDGGFGNTFHVGSRPDPILTGDEFGSAMAIAWSPDGRHVAYVVGLDPDALGVYARNEVHIADADGSDPAQVERPPALPDVDDSSRHYDHGASAQLGPVWSPDGTMVAVPWSTYSSTCADGPGCLPTSGIDVFSFDGSVVISFLTPKVFVPMPLWAPDSRRVAYMSGDEVSFDGTTERWDTTAFNAQSVARPGDVIVLKFAGQVFVTGWTGADRLLVLETAPVGDPSASSGVSLAYSMRPDGTDRRDVPGPFPGCGDGCAHSGQDVLWSPDGRWITFRSGERSVTFRDAATGADVTIALPKPMYPWLWAPDAGRLLLTSGGSMGVEPSDIYMVNADGTDLHRIGPAHEVSWRPVPSTTP
jgi:hypothetical protein